MNEAKQIREAIKKHFGFNSRQVSVTASRGSAINVRIKSEEVLPYIDQIKDVASNYETIHRCEASLEILSGGNLFVFVEIGYEFEKELIEKYHEEVEKIVLEAKGNPNKVYEYNGNKFFLDKADNQFHMIEQYNYNNIYSGDYPEHTIRFLIRNVDQKEVELKA